MKDNLLKQTSFKFIGAYVLLNVVFLILSLIFSGPSIKHEVLTITLDIATGADPYSFKDTLFAEVKPELNLKKSSIEPNIDNKMLIPILDIATGADPYLFKDTPFAEVKPGLNLEKPSIDSLEREILSLKKEILEIKDDKKSTFHPESQPNTLILWTMAWIIHIYIFLVVPIILGIAYTHFNDVLAKKIEEKTVESLSKSFDFIISKYSDLLKIQKEEKEELLEKQLGKLNND